MTLLELLVKELPKLGGWPGDRTVASNGINGTVVFHSKGRAPFIMGGLNFSGIGCVSCEEYEAALAESKQTEWNGFGLPPVGKKCQRSAFGDDWAECEVLYVGPEVIVVSVEGREKAYKNGAIKFRTLPTAADEARHAIAELCRSSASNGHSADLIYDAIAAGKIPGIRLTDDAGN